MAFSFQALLSFHSVSHHGVMQQYVVKTGQKFQCNINVAFLEGFAPFLNCLSFFHILIRIGSKLEKSATHVKNVVGHISV